MAIALSVCKSSLFVLLNVELNVRNPGSDVLAFAFFRANGVCLLL